MRNLLSSMAVFVPCDLQLQRANVVSISFKVSTTAARWTTDDIDAVDVRTKADSINKDACKK